MPSDTETRAAIRRTSFAYAAAMVAVIAAAFIFLRPFFIGPTSESTHEGGEIIDPSDPKSLGPPGGAAVQTVSAAGFVRAFEIRYQVDNATEFQDLPSDSDRDQVRQDLSSLVHSDVTFKTQFHVFATRPSVNDLIAYIDANILEPDLAVKASSAMQEHVWRQGSWICETRFAIVEKATGSDLSATSTSGNTTFTSTGYWIAAYDYH